jgi:DNA-binding transcriptional ArsR family regulator
MNSMSTSTLPTPLPDALVELIAQRFRLLSEPTRIKLLDALRDGPATVAELQAATGASQQNVSKHLGMLLDAGMVRRTKEGNRAFFSIADANLFDLCDQVCGSLRRQVAELDALLQMEGEPAR